MSEGERSAMKTFHLRSRCSLQGAIAVFLLFAVKGSVVLRWPDCSISRSTPWASGEHFSVAGNRASLYAVRTGVRSSSLILAMFAAMRRVSLRFPERLRRFGLVV